MVGLVKIKPMFKFWLETNTGYAFGEGPFNILSKVKELGTLSGAAENLHMSYRQAWGMIREIEQELGEPLLKAHRGGTSGGGAELTEAGLALLSQYSKTKRELEEFSKKIIAGYK